MRHFCLLSEAPGHHSGGLGAGTKFTGSGAVGDAGGHCLVHFDLHSGAHGPLGKGRLYPLRQTHELFLCQLLNVHVFLLSAGDRRVK